MRVVGQCVAQFHLVGDTLEVLDGTAEVDASQGLHVDVQYVTLLHLGHDERALAVDAVYLADVLAVQEHLGIVMCLGDLQHTLRLCALCHAGAVQQASPSHVHLLEGLQSAVLL